MAMPHFAYPSSLDGHLDSFHLFLFDLCLTMPLRNSCQILLMSSPPPFPFLLFLLCLQFWGLFGSTCLPTVLCSAGGVYIARESYTRKVSLLFLWYLEQFAQDVCLSSDLQSSLSFSGSAFLPFWVGSYVLSSCVAKIWVSCSPGSNLDVGNLILLL